MSVFANIRTFRTAAERRREAFLQPREQFVLALEEAGILEDGQADAVRLHFEAEADKVAATNWRFIMLGRQEAMEFDAWIYSGACRRPHLVARAIRTMECLARGDTGEVLATRAELAERCNTHPDNVSRALSDLERGGAITRRRDGRTVRIFLNPRLATGLPDGQRQAAQENAPRLALVTDNE